ncbi:MAG: hypothetical protein FWG64_07290 [Firmicutes bacterium]|nr:hypothetical protein [Bacillota bacterium]
MLIIATILCTGGFIYATKFFSPINATDITNKLVDDYLDHEEKAEINAVALARFVGCSIIVKLICLLIFAAALDFRLRWLAVLSTAAFVAVGLLYFWYIREFVIFGKHFRKKLDKS